MLQRKTCSWDSETVMFKRKNNDYSKSYALLTDPAGSTERWPSKLLVWIFSCYLLTFMIPASTLKFSFWGFVCLIFILIFTFLRFQLQFDLFLCVCTMRPFTHQVCCTALFSVIIIDWSPICTVPPPSWLLELRSPPPISQEHCRMSASHVSTPSSLHWVLVSSLYQWCWQAFPNPQAMLQSYTPTFGYHQPLVSLFSVMNWSVGPGCSSFWLPGREVTFSLYHSSTVTPYLSCKLNIFKIPDGPFFYLTK